MVELLHTTFLRRSMAAWLVARAARIVTNNSAKRNRSMSTDSENIRVNCQL